MLSEQTRIPEMVGWGITSRCNLSCPHCYSSATRRAEGELSSEEISRVIDQLGALGTTTIGWTGGEPLLRKDLERQSMYALERHGIESAITTNGLPLTRIRLQSLRDAGILRIQISLDGSTPERNERMRGASRRSFLRILGAVDTARDMGFQVHLAMILGAETLDDAHAMVDLARRSGVRSLRFCGYVPWGYGAGAEVRTRLDWTDCRQEIARLVENYAASTTPLVLFDPAFGPLPPHATYHECVAGERIMYIDSRGDVYPCTSLLDPQFSVGNVLARTVADIWNDPAMSRVAKYPRDRTHGACRECGHFEECRGACRGITYAYTGDLDASFPNCLSRTPIAAAAT